MTDHTTLLSTLHFGPKKHREKRHQFHLKDASIGDVYRCVLLGIKEDPATLNFGFHDVLDRIKRICLNDQPTGSSVKNALEQMVLMANALHPSERILDWNDDVLHVEDPYFLFFLRHSLLLYKLGIKVASLPDMVGVRKEIESSGILSSPEWGRGGRR